MRTRTLGPLEVSVVGLGCNNFGRRIDADATRAVVDAALEVGVTFFDTADVYGNRGGSETILGEVLQGRRDQVVLATKWGAMLDADDQQHGTRDFVRSALDASLQRLQTDHVDLYQHHQEDKRTPLDETFGALKELVDEGKILAVGTSNYEPASLEQAARIARELGVPYVTEQSEYSWLVRDAEDELLPTCERLGLGFIPYFPLASGLLTGKVSRDRPPAEGTRLHGSELDDAEARPRRGLSRVGRGARRLAARRRDRRSGGGVAGRLGDRRCDEAGAGARERCRRRLGTDAGRARRAAGALEGADRLAVRGDPDPPGGVERLLRHERAQPLDVGGESARSSGSSAARRAQRLPGGRARRTVTRPRTTDRPSARTRRWWSRSRRGRAGDEARRRRRGVRAAPGRARRRPRCRRSAPRSRPARRRAARAAPARRAAAPRGRPAPSRPAGRSRGRAAGPRAARPRADRHSSVESN